MPSVADGGRMPGWFWLAVEILTKSPPRCFRSRSCMIVCFLRGWNGNGGEAPLPVVTLLAQRFNVGPFFRSQELGDVILKPVARHPLRMYWMGLAFAASSSRASNPILRCVLCFLHRRPCCLSLLCGMHLCRYRSGSSFCSRRIQEMAFGQGAASWTLMNMPRAPLCASMALAGIQLKVSVVCGGLFGPSSYCDGRGPDFVAPLCHVIYDVFGAIFILEEELAEFERRSNATGCSGKSG